jgi:hypothetical protein
MLASRFRVGPAPCAPALAPDVRARAAPTTSTAPIACRIHSEKHVPTSGGEFLDQLANTPSSVLRSATRRLRRDPPMPRRPRLAAQVEQPPFLVKTRSSSCAPLGLSCGRSRLAPGVLCAFREPPTVCLERPGLQIGPPAALPALPRPFAVVAKFQANPRRDFAALRALCVAPPKVRRARREFRRARREFRRALRKVRPGRRRVRRAPPSPSPLASVPAPCDALRVRTAAPRCRRADVRALREPPRKSVDACSASPPFPASIRAARVRRCADLPSSTAARARRRASLPAPRASPFQNHRRPPGSSSGPPNVR